MIFARQTLLLNGAGARVYADEVREIVDIVTRYFFGCMVQIHVPADGQAHVVVRRYSVLFFAWCFAYCSQWWIALLDDTYVHRVDAFSGRASSIGDAQRF